MATILFKPCLLKQVCPLFWMIFLIVTSTLGFFTPILIINLIVAIAKDGISII